MVLERRQGMQAGEDHQGPGEVFVNRAGDIGLVGDLFTLLPELEAEL